MSHRAHLPNALAAWPSDVFPAILKADLLSLKQGVLPLHQGVTQGGFIDDADLEITLLRVSDSGQSIEADVGVFFTEIVICCGCGDDPMPVPAYCEMRVSIDKATARARFVVQPG